MKTWSDQSAVTPLTSFRRIAEMAKKKFGDQYDKITPAPWVYQAYAAENDERDKKKLRPLTWKRFIELITDEKSRKKMLVADKFMRAAFEQLAGRK